jgi:hypothetical protein
MRITLNMLYDFCAEKKLPLMVFTYAMDAQQQQVIDEVSAPKHVTVISVDPALKGATREIDLGDRHAHWNGYGNELVAHYLFPHIVSMISDK